MDFKTHHRSINAIIRAANKQGLYKPGEGWTTEEDDILRNYYPVEGEVAFTRLPLRTISSCRSRVLRLELNRRNSWSAEEDAILIACYPKEGPECFSKLSERSEPACRARVTTLNLHMDVRPTGVIWSDAEIEILKTYYPIEGTAVAARLPGRTEKTIKRYARVAGVKYTGPKRHTGQKQVRCIETDIVYSSAKEAATVLNISYKMVQACAAGTKKTGGGYHWEYVE